MFVGTSMLLTLSVAVVFSTAIQHPAAVADVGYDNPSYSDSDSTLIQGLGNTLKNGLINELLNSMAGSILDSVEGNITYACLNDTDMVRVGLLTGKKYAQRFIDAEAKVPSGILQGHWTWTGDYQECVSIMSPFNDFTGHAFKGKHSMVLLFRNGMPMFKFTSLSIGVCLPDSCTDDDVRVFSELLLSPLSEQNVTVAAVEGAEEIPTFSGGAIAAFTISGILTLLVIIGTIMDVLCKEDIINDSKLKLVGTENPAYSTEAERQEKTYITVEHAAVADTEVADSHKLVNGRSYGATQSTYEPKSSCRQATKTGTYNSYQRIFIIDCFKSFSLFNNTSKLLNTSTAHGPLACLNGLRVISMWWVIQGHTYSFITLVLDNGAYYRSTLSSRLSFQAIINGTYSVDSFFFLSGLLVAYMALNEWKKRGRINWVYYFGHRYWRLTPVYAFVMLLFTTLTSYLISGPFRWNLTSPNGMLYSATDNCKDYWWANLLYINNMYPDYGNTIGCMGWSWYLANDMQFYVILSPIVVVLLYKKRTIGWLVSTGLILACISIRAGLVSFYGIKLMDGGRTKHLDDPWGTDALYVHPWTRFSVYIVGMLTGHLLQSTNCKIRLTKLISLIGWCIATATALSVVYGMYYYNNSEHDGATMSYVASYFYNALDRTAWSLCLAWVTVACASGYGGWVNEILSWKIWAPLGRLTYCAYLLHPIIIVVYYFDAKTPYHFTDLFMINAFVSLTVITYGCSYIVSMIAEAPMMRLEKLILKKEK